MSLYDKASIALIPSGTKASKLYSVLPANGDGDFTHSRSLTTATRVNKDGLIESVAANVPRLDYPLTNGVAGDCPHLLLEPQRTNKIAYSEGFNNWSAVFTSVNLNEVVSPDGSVNATKLTDTSNSSTHRIQLGNTTSSSGSFCYSIFLKKGTLTTVALSVYSGAAAADSKFDLDNGTIVSTTNGTAEIQDYGNDWYRCIVKGTLASTSTTTYIYLKEKASYSGSSQFLYAWGAMLEEGSYPTSYIKTSGSTATRSADVCNKTGVQSLLGQTEGTLFLEFVPQNTSDLQIMFQIRTTGSTNVGQVDIRFQSSQIRALGSDNNGTTQFNILGGSITAGTNYKAAIRYKTNDAKFYINGSSVGTDTSCSFTSSTKQQISFAENLSSLLPSIKVKQAIVFNEALTDSELATLTS